VGDYPGGAGREANTVHVLNFSKFCGCFRHPQNKLSQKTLPEKVVSAKIYATDEFLYVTYILDSNGKLCSLKPCRLFPLESK